jgi:hypothetical protein
MTPDEKAALILRALSGEHLHGWLPNEDHKAAISRAVGTHHEWTAPKYCGRVTTKGIETYPSLDAMFVHNPSEVIPWREVIEIVAEGCGDGRRVAYETAFASWNQWAREDGYTIKTAKRPSDEEIDGSYQRWSAVSDGIHATTAAIINAGCARQTLQPELF